MILLHLLRLSNRNTTVSLTQVAFHYETKLIRFPRAGPDRKILSAPLKCLLIIYKPSKKSLFLSYYFEGWDFLAINSIVTEKKSNIAISFRHVTFLSFLNRRKTLSRFPSNEGFAEKALLRQGTTWTK